MANLKAPRVIIGGAQSRSGKSAVTLGLLQEFRKRGLSVACITSGANLHQAAILRRLSGRYVRCVDGRLLSGSQILTAFADAAVGSDLILVDGHRGLYDGYSAGTLRGSDSEVALATRTPVILVVDPRNFGNSIGAVVKGFSGLATGFGVNGTVLNFIDAPSEEELLEPRDRDYYEATFQALGVAVPIGGIPEVTLGGKLPVVIASDSGENLPRQFLLELNQLASQFIDIEKVLEIASNAPPVSLSGAATKVHPRRVKIGVSDDACFQLLFQDNLDLLSKAGAELVPFSPVADQSIPEGVGALYFGGAMINQFAEELAKNESMKRSIQEFVEAGGPLYAEGSGTAYLCEDFQVGDIAYVGAGVLKGVAERNPAPREEYIEGSLTQESVLGEMGTKITGISTNEWQLYSSGGLASALRIERLVGRGTAEGFTPTENSFLTFTYLHFGSAPEFAEQFVAAANAFKGRQ